MRGDSTIRRRPALGRRVPLTIGFVALADCATPVVAKEKGFFARHGLDVTLQREPSWANMRDKLALGALDAAHMLAPMPLAATAGAGGFRKPTLTAMVLSLNGTGFTVSASLYDRLLETEPKLRANRTAAVEGLRKLIKADRRAGKPPHTFATVFTYSAQNCELRYWLSAAGIDPEQDVRLVVVPPPMMAERLALGEIDGYCVGEPWNTVSVLSGAGRVLFTGQEIWANRPEKVLGVNRDWAERHGAEHRALLMAMLEAAQWADRPENRPEAAYLLAQPDYIGPAVAEALRYGLLGRFRRGRDCAVERIEDFQIFHRYAANFPWRSQAEWFLMQMRRWGQIAPEAEISAIADEAFRPDLYRAAAAALGIAYPLIDRKPEGLHAGNWMLAQASAPILMGPDTFLDGSYVPAGREPAISQSPPKRRVNQR